MCVLFFFCFYVCIFMHIVSCIFVRSAIFTSHLPPLLSFSTLHQILTVDPMTDILCRQNFFPSCKHVPHFTLAQYIFLFFTFPPTVAGLNGGKRNRRFLSTGHFNNLLQHVPVAHNGSLHKHVDIATDILLVDTLLAVELISFFFMSTQH